MGRKKQAALPGMEELGDIPEIEEAALDYASIRDERMKLTEKEVELKGALLEAMRKHKRMKYASEDLTIERVSGKETIKVKVKKDKSEEEAA